MTIVLFIAALLLLAAIIGAVSGRLAGTATGVLAGVGAFLGALLLSFTKLLLAVGEYEEDLAGYEGWVAETDFLVALAIHLLVPAAVLVAVRLAVLRFGSADRAADEREHDGQRAERDGAGTPGA